MKPDKRVTALRGLHELALMAAQTAVVIGGASPRAVVEELHYVARRLAAAGWLKLPRQAVVEQQTMKGS